MHGKYPVIFRHLSHVHRTFLNSNKRALSSPREITLRVMATSSFAFTQHFSLFFLLPLSNNNIIREESKATPQHTSAQHSTAYYSRA